MEKNKLNILNKIFSRSTFRNCFDNGYDKTYSQVVEDTSIMVQESKIQN